ncbi:MAG: DUF1080 domain-containing protein [Acidobacteriaceae bacterium]
MKVQRTLGSVVALIAVACACTFTQGCKQKSPAPSAAQTTQNSVAPFLGRWDLTLKTPQRERPSWLEISQDNGALKGTMVGESGSASPLAQVDITNGTLTFTSQKPFTAKLEEGKLVGTTTGPDGAQWTWTGVKAPSLATDTAPQWGKPISLFNARNLDGWHEYTADGSAPTKHWRVEHGILVSPGQGPELVSDKTFQNFKLHVEFKLGPDSNSGIYLRGRYEVQLETDSANESSLHHTGAIYGFLAPNPELPRIANKWESYDITLVGRNVTVVQNGKTIIDNQEIPGITGGALNSNEAEPGPIYLQGSEKGQVSFRKIVITPAVQ